MDITNENIMDMESSSQLIEVEVLGRGHRENDLLLTYRIMFVPLLAQHTLSRQNPTKRCPHIFLILKLTLPFVNFFLMPIKLFLLLLLWGISNVPFK